MKTRYPKSSYIEEINAYHWEEITSRSLRRGTENKEVHYTPSCKKEAKPSGTTAPNQRISNEQNLGT